MENTNMKEIGNRLRILRETREKGKLSQSNLAKELEKKVKIIMEGDTGKQTVSQLERGKRPLTLEMAHAYADIFGVSLDYIYCRQKDWKLEYKPIKELLGLSDGSINQIEYMESNNKYILDYLLNPQNGSSFIEWLSSLQEYLKMPREGKEERRILFEITEIAREIASELKKDID